MARRIFDSNTVGKLRLMGALLDGMRCEADGRLAVLSIDNETDATTGASVDDLDGLINLPLPGPRDRGRRDVQGDRARARSRVSARSKGDIDVRSVAVTYGGGGHKNAAGFDAPGRDDAARAAVVAQVATLFQR